MELLQPTRQDISCQLARVPPPVCDRNSLTPNSNPTIKHLVRAGARLAFVFAGAETSYKQCAALQKTLELLALLLLWRQ